jgi:hypothetical protein
MLGLESAKQNGKMLMLERDIALLQNSLLPAQGPGGNCQNVQS